MQKQATLNYEEQYAQALVQWNAFAVQATGLAQGQTLLKVDTYNLACVPYQFTMRRAVLVGSFSKDEIAFFQRFKNSVAGLSLAFQRPDAREPMKVFCRCQVAGVGMMKDREGVALIVLDWKPIPPDLAEVLGEYLSLVDRLKVEFGDFRDRRVPITPASAKSLGFNNYAVMSSGGVQTKLALFALAANYLEFLVPMRSADLAPGTEAVFSLYFLSYRFAVQGRIESAERLPTGVQRVRASIGFSAELVHLLEGYFSSRR